jgi:hypothetical protein
MSLLLTNRALIGGAGVPVPPVIEDGNTVGWYIASDLSTITKDVSDFVSVWEDKLGSGRDLLQAVGANQPKWFATNGILFDGLAHFMKTATFTYVQPHQIYMVFKQVTWALNDTVFDGDTQNSVVFYQTATTPDLKLFAGINSAANSNLAVDTFGISRTLANGASSSLQINETTAVTGDFGTNNMGGFTLGGRGAAGSNPMNIQVKEIILRKIVDTAPNNQAIYDYLAAKYSI